MMKSVEWKTYRTRFLIKAKQLNSPLSFTDPLGRTHCGRKGDYLVESYEGVLSITPRQIFEDIYVTMPDSAAASDNNPRSAGSFAPPANCVVDPASRFAAFDFEEVPALPQPLTRARRDESRVRRKLPQPFRDRRTLPSRLGMM